MIGWPFRMGQKSKRLRIAEVELEGNGQRSPLWDEVMRLLLSEPLTDSGEDDNMGREVSSGGDGRGEEETDG